MAAEPKDIKVLLIPDGEWVEEKDGKYTKFSKQIQVEGNNGSRWIKCSVNSKGAAQKLQANTTYKGYFFKDEEDNWCMSITVKLNPELGAPQQDGGGYGGGGSKPYSGGAGGSRSHGDQGPAIMAQVALKSAVEAHPVPSKGLTQEYLSEIDMLAKAFFRTMKGLTGQATGSAEAEAPPSAPPAKPKREAPPPPPENDDDLPF
jgi:hypothetical protein